MTRRQGVGAALTACAIAGTAALAAAQSQSLPTTPVLTLDLAQRAATAANAACQQQGIAVTTTVVDAAGTAVAQLRADGATAATVDVSRGKAFAAAGFKTPTNVLRDSAKTNPGFLTVPGFIVLAGGLPIAIGGQVVGAVGVSGAPSDDTDQTCAQAGLAAIGASAPPADGGDGGAADGGASDGGM